MKQHMEIGTPQSPIAEDAGIHLANIVTLLFFL